MAAASNATCSVKTEQKGLPLSVVRMMGLTTAVALLGSTKRLADAMGISDRALYYKLEGERGVSDDNLIAAAEALDAQAAKVTALAAKIAGHAAKLRAEAAPDPAPIADGVPA